jgi:hypothetical protein
VDRLEEIRQRLHLLEKKVRKITAVEKSRGKGEITYNDDKWNLTYLGHSYGFFKPVGKYKKRYYAKLAAKRRGMQIARVTDKEGKTVERFGKKVKHVEL